MQFIAATVFLSLLSGALANCAKPNKSMGGSVWALGACNIDTEHGRQSYPCITECKDETVACQVFNGKGTCH